MQLHSIKLSEYIEIGKGEGRLVAGGTADDSVGYFVNPTVFADVAPTARIMKEEIFGPVVAITKADTFEEAIAIANNTEYGLTGAVITKNRKNLEYAREEFHVGNLILQPWLYRCNRRLPTIWWL